jgi:hypothetical protein
MEALVRQGMTRWVVLPRRPVPLFAAVGFSVPVLTPPVVAGVLALRSSIGVSNFSVAKLQRLLEGAEIRPAVNQVRAASVQEFCGLVLVEFKGLRVGWGQGALC